MYQVIRAGEQQRSPGGTVTFEGEPHGSGVSFFLVNNEPGEGPDLHRHPYSETWIVRSGRARITADGEDIEAGPGDIAVVGPETPHKFKNMGPGRLDIILYPLLASADPGGTRMRFRSRIGPKSPMEA
jgi:mannose-6-phosphate isomerase-like protein (cupin superfamily)